MDLDRIQGGIGIIAAYTSLPTTDDPTGSVQKVLEPGEGVPRLWVRLLFKEEK